MDTNAVWTNNTMRWGPYLDNQQRSFTYLLAGPSGTYPLAGQGSFDGYPAVVSGAAAVLVDANYSGEPSTNYPVCTTKPIIYNVNINPMPGVMRITSANGIVDWGDGTQSAITQPIMTFQRFYATSGTYTITVSADWTGGPICQPGQYCPQFLIGGHSTKTDTINAIAQCDPPYIVTQPFNQVVLAGATAQFSITATSLFPMSFQWYFNQANPIISPATLGTLILPNVTVQEAGLYSVLVTNINGNATSSVFTLTVVTPLVSSVARNSNGSVSLGFVGLPNTTTRIWAASNLASPIFWQPIFTNSSTTTNGTWQFTDTNTIHLPERFYRFSTP
jgi:hypothetical protein